MRVTRHTTRVDENRITTIQDDDPMFGVLQGSVKKQDFVKHDWDQVGNVVHHFHRAFGNSRLVIELCEMEICGILHCMYPKNRLQVEVQRDLRSAIGKESHLFQWSGWKLAALMDAMWWETDYVHEIKHYFQNCIGRDLATLYSRLQYESDRSNT